MDIVAFVLNTVIGVVLIGGTIGFLMQQEPPSAVVLNGVPEDIEESPEPSVSPGPCANKKEACAGPSYAPPPTRSA